MRGKKPRKTGALKVPGGDLGVNQRAFNFCSAEGRVEFRAREANLVLIVVPNKQGA